MESFLISKRRCYPTYVVFSNDNSIANAISTLFGNPPQIDSGSPQFFNITVLKLYDNSYLLDFHGKRIRTRFPVQVIENILFSETVFDPSVFPLHGGGIETGGKAHLFLAPTHVGKTTLIAYLTQRGYPYINDDRILIDMDTHSVIPDATPIHLRPESIPILKQYGCSINGNEIRIESIRRIVYSPKNTVLSALKIDNIFFIKRSQTENACQTMQCDEAVRLLMAGLFSPKAYDGNRLKCAIRLASKCKRLIYSDMRYVADLLEKEKF